MICKLKFIIVMFMMMAVGCNNERSAPDAPKTDTMRKSPQTDQISNKIEVSIDTISKPYSNTRFRNTTVEKLSEDKFRVRGQGQIFEANFGWIVEDGHEELLKGHQMTDAGAPEWGNFDFTIVVRKKRSNSTLTLILFEVSAMDGSRQYQLPINLN